MSVYCSINNNLTYVYIYMYIYIYVCVHYPAVIIHKAVIS